jgi:hypothetical protein
MQNTCRCCLLNDDNQILLDMIQNEILFESSDNRVSASFMEVSFFLLKFQNKMSHSITFFTGLRKMLWLGKRRNRHYTDNRY